MLLVLPLLLWGQGASDSALASSAPRLLSTLDRYTIDVATIVRDGTALELSEVLISRIPGLLVVPGPASVVPGTPLAAQATAVTASMLPSAYYEDADYLKLRELAIAFDLPEGAAALFGARAATVVSGGRDLATWTKYSGADPEAASYGVHRPSTPMAIGDVGTVPLARTWTLRVRVSY